jgi:hypothetical protein
VAFLLGEIGFGVWITVDLLRELNVAPGVHTLHLVGIALVLAHIAYKIAKKVKRPAIVWAGYCVPIAGLIVLVYRPQRPSETFRVVIKRVLPSNSTEATAFWLVQNVMNREVASPIHVMAYIQFTNLKPTPFLIDSYGVQLELTNGSRIALVPIDLRDGGLFFADSKTNSTHAREINIRYNDFNSRIHNNNIRSKETIEGWVALEGTNWLDAARCIFSAMDANAMEWHTNYFLPPDTGGGVQLKAHYAEFLMKGDRDISNLPVWLYSRLPTEGRFRNP